MLPSRPKWTSMLVGNFDRQVPSKLRFWTFQRLFHYSQIKTETEFLSPYSERAQFWSSLIAFDWLATLFSGSKVNKHYAQKLSDHPLFHNTDVTNSSYRMSHKSSAFWKKFLVLTYNKSKNDQIFVPLSLLIR